MYHVAFVSQQDERHGVRRRGGAAAAATVIASLMLGPDILELLLHDLDVVETVSVRDGIDQDEAVGPEDRFR